MLVSITGVLENKVFRLSRNHRQGHSGKENLKPSVAKMLRVLSLVSCNKIQTKMWEPSRGLLTSRFGADPEASCWVCVP